MEDFYFAYGYEPKKKKASRLYRFVEGRFERYDSGTHRWIPSPEQCRIFAGEDWDYDEVTPEEAEKIKGMLVI